jgi:hypothetical protein
MVDPDEGLAGKRAALGAGGIVDDRRPMARSDTDIRLGPELAVVVGILAGTAAPDNPSRH